MASTQTGDSAADQAKDKAQQATQQARESAQQAGQQAKSRVRDEVDRRSTEVGEQATSVADAIRQASQQLHEQGKGQAAKPMEQAAQRVESAGQWLRDSDGDTILGDVEDFARRKPMAVLAGGIAVGFALSRLLKASSTQRYQSGGTATRSGYGDGNGTSRGELPPPRPISQPSTATTPARSGGVDVPDLPAPPPPASPTGSPDAPPTPYSPGTGAVTPGGAVRGGPPPGGTTGA